MKTLPVNELYDFEPHDRGLIPAKDYLPITAGCGSETDPYIFESYPSDKVARAEEWVLDLHTLFGIYTYEITDRQRVKVSDRIIDIFTLDVSIDFREPLKVYFDVTKAVK